MPEVDRKRNVVRGIKENSSKDSTLYCNVEDNVRLWRECARGAVSKPCGYLGVPYKVTYRSIYIFRNGCVMTEKRATIVAVERKCKMQNPKKVGQNITKSTPDILANIKCDVGLWCRK